MRRDVLDPGPDLREMRESAGIHRMDSLLGVPAYVITRHDDVKAALADHERFSNHRPPELVRPPGAVVTEEERDIGIGSLLAMDPPDHQRLRRMLTPEFTVRRMKRLEPRIAEIVDQHLDAMERSGPPADLVADFALPIPSLVICELLGVPYADRDEFQERTARQLNFSLSFEQRRELQLAGRAYMHELVRRARREPGEDMLGMLVREHGGELSRAELVGIAWLLLVAGHETTSNMLGLGTLALLQHPEQLALLRDDPARVGPAVEELLRWLSIVHSGVPRTARTDVQVAGREIAAGDLVLVSLPMANRDPSLVDDPQRLDLTRGAAGHVAFGHGAHHCLGAPLARMEMRVAFPALLRRFPGLALAEEPGEVRFREYNLIYGARSLAVTW